MAVQFQSGSFLDGKTVTMTAIQGSDTSGPFTIPDYGAAGPGPATLTVTAQEIVPPEGTFAPYPVEWRIRVTGTSYGTPDWAPVRADPYHGITQGEEDTIRLNIEAYDESYQRCHFVVHTGDSGNYRNDWVGSAAHRSKAYQYGQNCGHVYSDPGTYSGRSIYVYDDEGNWGTLSLSDLVVTDPDTDFDSASTIVVSPTSDFTGAPAHDPANECTTMDAAAARFDAIKNGLPAGARICVQSGASFSERARQFNSRDARGPCLVDTYGGSAQFTYSERGLDVPCTGDHLFYVNSYPAWAWRIKGGSFDMGYDIVDGRPTNPDGWLGGANTMSRSFFLCDFPATIYDSLGTPAATKGDPAAKIVFDNVDVTGCGWFCVITLSGAGEIEGRNVAMFANDCDFYGNPEYAFMTPQNLFSLGSKFRALPDGDLGGMGRSMAMGTSRGWTGHPIFLREQFAWTVYVRACYIEARGGWSGSSSQTAYRGGQAIMRLNNRGTNEIGYGAAGWVNGRGRRYYFCDSVMSGYFGLDLDGDILQPDLLEPAGGAHVVLENCMLFIDPMTGGRESLLYDFNARHSIRNNVFLATNEPEYWLNNMTGRNSSGFDVADNRFGRMRQFITNDVTNTFKDGGRVENRHNTYVCLRTTANIEFGTFSVRGSGHSSSSFIDGNQDMAEGHNVVHAPNLDTPINVPMDTIDLPVGMRILDPWIRFTWESIRFVLASDVLNGADTPAIPYGNDWYDSAMTGADFTGTASTNSLENEDISGTRYFEPPEDFPNVSGRQTVPKENVDMMTVIHDCNSSGVVQGDGSGTHFKVTNRSGVTWVAGNYRAILDRGSTGMAPDKPGVSGTFMQAVDQSEFKLYRPTTPQALDGGLGSTLYDFNRNLRPNAGYAISPTVGANAAGAILP